MNLVNAKNKTNIEPVSYGNNQIEFFSIDGKPCFVLYNPNPESYSQISLQLDQCTIQLSSNGGFIIKSGASKYILNIQRRDNVITSSVTRVIFGWLPLSRYSGKLTEKGLGIVNAQLRKFT